MNIRHGTVHDAAALTELKGPRSEEDRRTSEERQHARIAAVGKGRAAYLLAEQEGEVVGHAYLRFDGTPTAPEYPAMEDLYVREDRRSHWAYTR